MDTADRARKDLSRPPRTCLHIARQSRWNEQGQAALPVAAPSSQSLPIEDISTGGDEPDEQERLAARGSLTLSKPNVTFTVGSSLGLQVEVLAGPAHQSASPPAHPRRRQRYEIALVMDARHLQQAAASLERDLAAFPPP